MDRKEAKRVLTDFGNPVIDCGKTKLVFARQSTKDVAYIEEMSDDELVKEWRGLCQVNHILGCVSLNELQRISLIELEMDRRKGIDHDALRAWFDESMDKQKAYEEKEHQKWLAEEAKKKKR